MANKVSEGLKTSILDVMLSYDGMSQSIRLAKLNGVPDSGIQKLILNKQSLKTEFDAITKKLLGAMNLNSNVVPLGEQWYGIRYVTEKGDVLVKLDILVESDVPILRRDGRRERELSRSDLDAMLPGCIDEVKLSMYKELVRSTAVSYVYEYTGVIIGESQSEPTRMSVSSHAGKRYVQRKLGIGMNNDDVADAYRRANMVDIEKAVIEGYDNAVLMWTSEDGITYSFDGDNIMYVVGNNNIITLYEEDFGFTKEINRMITFEQAEVLAESYTELGEVEQEQREVLEASAAELQGIDNEIEILEAKIALLVAEKATITTQRDQFSKQVRVVRTKFNKEFDKLFKKWDN